MGTFAGIAHGTGFPLLSIVLGGMTTIFLRAENSDFVRGYSVIVNNSALSQITKEEFDASVSILKILSIILSKCTMKTAIEHNKSLGSILNKAETLPLVSLSRHYTVTRAIKNFSDLERVREGLGDKLSMMIQLMAAFIAGFIVGFIYNWRMTLVRSSFRILVTSFSVS
uniref:ABC transmembrane type-1 domain-containing protein n=1 Tax=Parascaris equorum TaxID=6256 RepID=A0A914RXB9_PAREQ